MKNISQDEKTAFAKKKRRAKNEPTMSGEEEIGRMMISQEFFVGRDREVRRVFHAFFRVNGTELRCVRVNKETSFD